jgi:hypothetical protein
VPQHLQRIVGRLVFAVIGHRVVQYMDALYTPESPLRPVPCPLPVVAFGKGRPPRAAGRPEQRPPPHMVGRLD